MIDEFIVLGSKCYAFKCGGDSKNKLKVVSTSQSKNIRFEEYKVCLDGEENENVCSNHILKSINHEKCMQEITKSFLSIFDDESNYLDNFQSLPWT